MQTNGEKQKVTLEYLLGVLILIVWAVTFWWIQDQTNRLRLLELQMGRIESSISAIQPYRDAERAANQAAMEKKDILLEKTIDFVHDLNTVVQNLGKAQIELRTTLEQIKDQIYKKGYNTK